MGKLSQIRSRKYKYRFKFKESEKKGVKFKKDQLRYLQKRNLNRGLMEKIGRSQSFVFRKLIIFCMISIVPIVSLAARSSKSKEQKSHASSCLKLGQGETQNGIDDKLPTQCCKPLKDREPSESCGVPTGGGYQYACIACGDGKCDGNLENTCNCPEDCK